MIFAEYKNQKNKNKNKTKQNKKKRYTFHQNQASGFIQRRLVYFFSFRNTLQDFIKKADVFASFPTDHSSILFLKKDKGNDSVRGRGLWKFNKSLIPGSKYIESMKTHL